MTLERGNGERHGQIGLTGTGGTQAKGDGMRADGVNIAFLAERLGTNNAAAIRQQHVIAQRRGITLSIAQDSQATRDIVGRQRASGSRLAKSMLKKRTTSSTSSGSPLTAILSPRATTWARTEALERTKDAVAGAQNARGINPLGNGKFNLRGFHEPPCAHGPSRNHRLR